MSLQKAEAIKSKNEADADFDEANYDAYGNKVKNEEEGKGDEDSEEKDMSDAAKIKENLRNSSKIYYNITHSVKENIEE